jgi:murein DD-endopeptidase MepM/ murein hydrolase activator NlpD
MKPWILLSCLASAAAGLLGPATPASAAPNVPIEQVQPDIGGTLVYLPLAAAVAGGPRSAQLSVDLYLHNLEAAPQTVQSVSVEYPGSSQATVSLGAGLQMFCPWSAGSPGSLVIPSGQTCRLLLLSSTGSDLKLAQPTPPQATFKVFFASQPTLPVTATRTLAAHVNDTPTGSYRFPARAADLPAGVFWSGQSSGVGSHHRLLDRSQVFASDMGLTRFDPVAGAWTAFVGATPTTPQNADFLVWGTPVYAMAAGEVIACQDGNADNLPGTPTALQGAANFVKIDHGTEVTWYWHLKNGSIDPGVCFPGALVAEGQKLGEVGDSGASSAPHLHVQVSRGPIGVPMLFNDIFCLERIANQPAGAGPFAEVRGAGLPWEKTVTWPAPLRRQNEAGGVDIQAVAMASASSNRKVTVARDLAGDLRVDLWRVETSGAVTALGSDTDGGVAAVAAARPQGTDDVTAVIQTAAGDLELIAYNVVGSSLVRGPSRVVGPVQGVAAATAPFPKGIVTAIRTQFGNLKVIAWQADASAGTISRLGEDVGSTTRAVALAETVFFPGVVAAVRTGSDTLSLISFGVSAGGFVDREDDETLNVPIRTVAVTRIGSHDGRDRLVTAAERLDGDLEVTAWEVDSTGHVTRLGTTTAGPATAVSVSAASAEHALTVISDGGGDLKLIAWHVDGAGNLVRRANAQGGGATATAAAFAPPVGFGNPAYAVTAVRTASDALKLISWQVVLTD